MTTDKRYLMCPESRDVDISACRAKVAGISNLVVCQTEKFACPCMVYFGRERFCIHPDNMKLAEAGTAG